MKKSSLIIPIAFSLLFFACSDPEVEKQEALLKEITCKKDLLISISENSDNTFALALKIGMKKELEQFMAIESDTTVSCDSLQTAWSNFQDAVLSKSSQE
jgi:hypothetical protein